MIYSIPKQVRDKLFVQTALLSDCTTVTSAFVSLLCYSGHLDLLFFRDIIMPACCLFLKG